MLTCLQNTEECVIETRFWTLICTFLSMIWDSVTENHDLVSLCNELFFFVENNLEIWYRFELSQRVSTGHCSCFISRTEQKKKMMKMKAALEMESPLYSSNFEGIHTLPLHAETAFKPNPTCLLLTVFLAIIIVITGSDGVIRYLSTLLHIWL